MDRADKASPVELFYRNGILDRRYGGDLEGLRQKLGYLKELGVTALYLNPIFYARSLHKYDGNSFHHIDPYFGPDPEGDLEMMARETADPATWGWTAADKLFLQVVREAKALGIRVVIDGVFNHTGRDFFAFADLRKRGADSPYADWYRVRSFDNPATSRNEFDYKSWAGYRSLPVFAATPDGRNMAAGPKDYVFAATRRWMDPDGDGNPSDGIDGWRLDVADELPPDFWADWHELVRAINPQAYTTAEVWSNPLELIGHGGFSAAMNYHGFAIPVKGFLVDKHIPPSRFAQMFDERRAALPPDIALAMMNLMDSHDTDRVASMCVNGEAIAYTDPNHIAYNDRATPRRSAMYDIRKPDNRARAIQRLTAFLQFTAAGAPMIYYGTEAGMWGAGDPDCRMPMVWPDIPFAAQKTDPRGGAREPDEVAFDDALHAFYREGFTLRRGQEALRRGSQRTLATDDERWLFAFERTLDGEAVIVAFNRSDASQTLRLEPGPATLQALGDTPTILMQTALGDGKAAARIEGNALILELPPLSAVCVGARRSR
jgi:glycosidase